MIILLVLKSDTKEVIASYNSSEWVCEIDEGDLVPLFFGRDDVRVSRLDGAYKFYKDGKMITHIYDRRAFQLLSLDLDMMGIR